jgi:hypothetical protein
MPYALRKFFGLTMPYSPLQFQGSDLLTYVLQQRLVTPGIRQLVTPWFHLWIIPVRSNTSHPVHSGQHPQILTFDN